MNGVYEGAVQTQWVFAENGWKFCIIGGLAVVRWGHPRTTQDADFCLLTGFGDEDSFIEVLSQEFPERAKDEAEFAKRFRVYRGFAPNGTPVDISLAGMPYELEMIDRASEYEFLPNCTLRTCAAEDLIVMKAFAGREQDWADVKNVAACQWDALDWNLIDRSLEGLCRFAENLTSVPKLESIRQDLGIELG